MSMYADYAKERLSRETLETDYGFATYEFKDDLCYISDIYVVPEARRSKVGSDIASKIEAIAKEKGAKKLLGSIVPAAKGSTGSMKAMLAYGFQIQSCHENFIWLEKEIV